MELSEMYQALERLKNQGEIVNAYCGAEKDIDNPDGDVLIDLMEYTYTNYPNERPIWLETFFQIFNWQYSSMHESIDTYYSNFYGDSDYQTITKVAQFLNDNKYTVVAEKYTFGLEQGLTDYEIGKYPDEKKEIVKQLDIWINWNTEAVWEFYLYILEKHKNDWPDIQ